MNSSAGKAATVEVEIE